MRTAPLLILLALSSPAVAQDAPRDTQPVILKADPALDARVNELLGILQGTGNHDAFFAPAVVAQLPKEKFAAITAQLTATYGPPDAILDVQPLSPWSGLVRVQFRDSVALVQLAVDPSPPHQVTTLLIKGFEAREKTLDQVVAAIRALPGETGFALARLGSGAPQLLVSHNADAPLAIGSAFKLLILAELVRATNAGERSWDDKVTLDGKELPGGGYRGKPAGTQVSLRELATQMISVSDNSATDILLATLGRREVEAMLPVVGIADPARNRPFLSTMELFKLKGIGDGDLARRYLAKDETGRREMLDGEVAAALPLAIRATLFRDGKPVMIRELEWFESPTDLVRVMDWLRRNTEGPTGAEARAVLSKNPMLMPDARNRWQWVGYKGGSEPGVLNLTLLLQAKNGDWYVLTAGWNDPAKAVDEGRLISLINRAAELAAPSP